MATFVIGYDICDPRRLQKMHRTLTQHGTAIEYSIFVLDANARALRDCMNDVLPILDMRYDDLRCYRLPQRGWRGRLGCATLPAGIIWTGLPASIAHGAFNMNGP